LLQHALPTHCNVVNGVAAKDGIAIAQAILPGGNTAAAALVHTICIIGAHTAIGRERIVRVLGCDISPESGVTAAVRCRRWVCWDHRTFSQLTLTLRREEVNGIAANNSIALVFTTRHGSKCVHALRSTCINLHTPGFRKRVVRAVGWDIIPESGVTAAVRYRRWGWWDQRTRFQLTLTLRRKEVNGIAAKHRITPVLTIAW
jgi:hypothetical protein